MTAEEAIRLYTEKFGGFPYFLFRGAADSYIIDSVQRALETGQEIRAADENADY